MQRVAVAAQRADSETVIVQLLLEFVEFALAFQHRQFAVSIAWIVSSTELHSIDLVALQLLQNVFQRQLRQQWGEYADSHADLLSGAGGLAAGEVWITAKNRISLSGMKKMRLLVVRACLLPAGFLFHAIPAQPAEPRFEVSCAAPAHDGPLTGRIFVAVAKAESPEPIQQIGSYTGKTPFFGIDVEQLPPGRAVTVDSSTRAIRRTASRTSRWATTTCRRWRTSTPSFIAPTGTPFGPTWEGQRFTRSPGNLASAVQRVHLDPAAGYNVKLELTKALPPVDFFGGTWTMYPDPIDFRRYQLVDIYSDENAFVVPGYEYMVPERPMMRTPEGQVVQTMRQMSQLEDVLGSHGRSAQQFEAWEAVYGPVGEDGYPRPLFDKRTGKIDRSVATYMKEHGYDLAAYMKANWTKLGPQLKGKLHLYVGDMDNYYLNLAVYLLEDYLKTTDSDATFEYGRPKKGHGWQPMTNAELVKMMAAQIGRYAPAR